MQRADRFRPTRARAAARCAALASLVGCATTQRPDGTEARGEPRAETAAQPTSQPTSRPTGRPTSARDADGLVDAVEARHGAAAWALARAVRAHLRVAFGKNPPLEGTLTFEVHGGRVRLDLADGEVLVFDGARAWAAPSAFPRARFHLLTWPYFLAAPFKLGDPGSALEDAGEHPLVAEGPALRCARLSFAAGTGDTPDDWYDVYVAADGMLAGLGYIVTYGKALSDAEQSPHAVVYEDARAVDGVLLAHRWRFFHWSRAEGTHGDPLGEATLSDAALLLDPPAGTFDKPTDAVEDALPPR